MKAFWWVVREIYSLRETLTKNFDVNSTNVTESNERTNTRTNERTYERTNGQTSRRKLYTPRHKCRGYNKTDHVCISVHGEKSGFLILYIFVLIECLSKNIIEFEFENVLFISIFSLFYPITLEGCRGTTDEFATMPFHLDLFSAALVELAKSIPVHSLILSSTISLSTCT